MAKFEIEKIFQLGGEHLHDWTHWKLYNDKERTNLIMESDKIPEDLKVWEPIIVDEGEMYDGSYGVYLSVQISYNGVVKPWKDEEACCLNAMMKNGLPCPDKPKSASFKLSIKAYDEFSFSFIGTVWVGDDESNLLSTGDTLIGDVVINGNDVTAFRVSNNLTVTEAVLLKAKDLTNMEYAFYKNGILTKFSAQPGTMSKVTKIDNAFRYNYNLTTVSFADTPVIANLNYTFDNCRSLVNVGYMNLSNITTAYGSFRGNYSLVKVPEMDWSKVTNFSDLFRDCNNLTDVGVIDASSAQSTRYMFYGCKALRNLTMVNTSKVDTLEYMFHGCDFSTYPGITFPAADNVKNMLSSNTSLLSFDGNYIGRPTYCDRLFNGNTGMLCLRRIDTTKGGGIDMFTNVNLIDLTATMKTSIENGYLYDRGSDC